MVRSCLSRLDKQTNINNSANEDRTFQLCVLYTQKNIDICNLREPSISCISSLCSIGKLSFPSFSTFSFLFSSQYLVLFLKSSMSCVLLLPTSFTSVICPSMGSWICLNNNWLLYVCYCLEASSFLRYTQELLHSYFLWSSFLPHSPPEHISKLFK